MKKILILLPIISLLTACDPPSHGFLDPNGTVTVTEHMGTLENGCTLNRYKWYENKESTTYTYGRYLLCPSSATITTTYQSGKSELSETLIITTEEYEKKVKNRAMAKLTEEEIKILTQNK